jgi:hypothetical protein
MLSNILIYIIKNRFSYIITNSKGKAVKRQNCAAPRDLRAAANGEIGCRSKAINRKNGSYGLKHEAERYMGAYISNGAFIAAAYLEGYAIERDGPNACFSLSFTPEYRRLRIGR